MKKKVLCTALAVTMLLTTTASATAKPWWISKYRVTFDNELGIMGYVTLHFASDGGSFAEMNEVTPMILQELIEKIEVHAVEGTGLNRTQSVVIHYKFIGELDMPENFDKIKVNTRKGVEVEYLRTTKTT